MDHLDFTQWIDFARGLGSLQTASGSLSEHSSQVREHVKNCSKCAEEMEILERALQVSRLEQSYSPPSDVLEAALAIFPATARKVSQPWAGLHVIAAELFGNSIEDAVPAGIRSLCSDLQHFSYTAGKYSVDLRLENDMANRMITLTGQIVDNDEPDSPVQGAQAVLLAGENPVACVFANEFGEFYLQYKRARSLRLFVPLEARGECIELSLDGPNPGK